MADGAANRRAVIGMASQVEMAEINSAFAEQLSRNRIKADMRRGGESRLGWCFIDRPVLSELPQVGGHLAAKPSDTIRRLQSDAFRKLAPTLQAIDGRHGERHHGQQLGPQYKRRFDVRDTRQRLWHAPTMPIPPHAISGLWWLIVAALRHQCGFQRLRLPRVRLPA